MIFISQLKYNCISSLFLTMPLQKYVCVYFCQKPCDALHYLIENVFEPVPEIPNNVVCATSKASDQPAHTRSLIRDFACRLTSIWLLSYWLNTIWSF